MTEHDEDRATMVALMERLMAPEPMTVPEIRAGQAVVRKMLGKDRGELVAFALGILGWANRRLFMLAPFPGGDDDDQSPPPTGH